MNQLTKFKLDPWKLDWFFFRGKSLIGSRFMMILDSVIIVHEYLVYSNEIEAMIK